MRDHIPSFLQHIADHAPRTIKTYGAVLASFAALAGVLDPPSPLQRTIVEGFLARPRRDGARRSPATRNQELAALRAFVKFAQRDLGWAENPTEGIPFAREAPRDPPVLSVFELRRLFTAVASGADDTQRARDLAILAVLSQAGLRVHELAGLDVAQLDIMSATLVAVRGKGGTVHDVPLNSPTITLLGAWLARRDAIALPGESALFVSRTGGRLSVRAVQRLVAGLRQAIGSAKRITPHTLRHTTATLALTFGADLSTVADLLRHSDVNTTRRYLHLVDERRREAVRRLGTAIPAELLHEPELPPGNVSAAATSNVLAAPETLDVQHGLDDAGFAA